MSEPTPTPRQTVERLHAMIESYCAHRFTPEDVIALDVALRKLEAHEALVAAMQELVDHADYALDTTGQRTYPPRFAPSAAKFIRDICLKALALSDGAKP